MQITVSLLMEQVVANAKKCARCQVEFVAGVRDTNRRYCSAMCRETFWDEKRTKNVTRGEWVKGRYATPMKPVELSVADAAYVAGFVDGEGHIGIVRERRAGNASGYRYSVTFEIANTNKVVLDRVNKALGGNGWISNPDPNNHRYPNTKPLYRIRFSRHQIAYLLPMLLPYLTVKQRPAELALKFIALMESAPMRTSRFHDQFDVMWQESKILNKRGR